MPRRPRFVLPGVAHHVTQRGNHQQNVFLDDSDRIRYLHILREHSLRHDLRILGWCLMTNHVHLIAIPGASESLSLAPRRGSLSLYVGVEPAAPLELPPLARAMLLLSTARDELTDWPWLRWLKEARLSGDWDYADWKLSL